MADSQSAARFGMADRKVWCGQYIYRSKSDSEYKWAIVDKVRGVIGPDASMIDAALQYILSYRETATVIPGMRTSEQVRGNLSAADVPMSEEMKQTLRQFWIEEIEGKDFPW